MIQFVTISDKDSTKINNYKNSLKKDFVCLEFDKKLKNISKIIKFYDYIMSANLQSNDVIVYSDAYDVICINLDNIEEEFISTKKDIIFASENFCAHYSNNVKEWFQSEYGNDFLNAGFSIGYYNSYKKFYHYIMTNHKFGKDLSEQRIISDFYMRNHKDKMIKMDLDTKSIFCKTIPINVSFNPSMIKSHFIHITWIDNPIQYKKYNDFVNYYLTIE